MNLHTSGRGREAVAAFVGLSMLGAFAACADILGLDTNRSLQAIDSGSGDDSAAMPEAAGRMDTGAADTGAPDAGVEAGPWDCLSAPPQTFDPGAMTTVNFIAANSLMPVMSADEVDGGSALDLTSYTPIPGLPVRACSGVLDPTCSSGTNWVTTDEAGVAVFNLLQSFNGYYEYQDPDGSLFTTTAWPSQMVAGETKAEIPGIILPAAGEKLLESVLPGITLSHATDGGLGHILLSVYDCHDHFAPNVYFTPSAIAPNGSGYQTLIFYTVGQMHLPSTTAKSTDQGGAGGLLNVPAGAFTVTAYLNLPSGAIQLAVLDVNVRPGLATSGLIRVRTR
jgi:hypothetical protein